MALIVKRAKGKTAARSRRHFRVRKAVAGTTVVATVNDIVDVFNEDVEGLQDLKGYKVVVDVINRLVP